MVAISKIGPLTCGLNPQIFCEIGRLMVVSRDNTPKLVVVLGDESTFGAKKIIFWLAKNGRLT
jgi:hypothetical protein